MHESNLAKPKPSVLLEFLKSRDITDVNTVSIKYHDLEGIIYEYLDNKLISHYYRVENKDDTLSLIHTAAINGEVEVMKILLDANVDKEARDNKNQTPLHYAAEYGRIEVVRMLLDANVDKEAKDIYGQTPLYKVVIGPDWFDFNDSDEDEFDVENKLETVKLLLERGVDKDVRNTWRETVLHVFSTNKNELKILKCLLDNGFRDDSLDSGGRNLIEHFLDD